MTYLLTLMMTSPLDVLASSMEAMSRAVREFQMALSEMASVPTLTASAVSDPNLVWSSPVEHSGAAVTIAEPVFDTSHNEKEKVHMPDQDLSGSDLKLVRYKVLFTKRGYEHAFPEQEELVHDDMDAGRFTAWKISEFVQSLADAEMTVRRVSSKWGAALVRKAMEEVGASGAPDPDRHDKYVAAKDGKYYIKDLPHEDKKFLRLFFEVLDRFPREDLRYEERQIEVLEQIRDKMPEGSKSDPKWSGP
jgi:hypothetical protein